MFQDLTARSEAPARARFGGSMLIALAVYGGAGALLVAASATARQVVEEKLMQVTFAVAPPVPEPAPPPPVAEPARAEPLRPKVKRAALKPPTELPADKPKESDRPLAAAEPAGPVDGFLDGAEGGRGSAAAPPPPPPPPPPAPAATLVPPVALRTNTPPSYSTRARIERVEGTVVVSFEVLENGQVGDARVISGPRELHESVLKTVQSWRFTPAKRGGTPVRFKKTQSIVFRLEDA